MTEREMLMYAAKAAVYKVVIFTDGSMKLKGEMKYWNPLTDDGDAFRLAVRLGINVVPNYHASVESQGLIEFTEVLDYSPDPCAPTRLAITRAAAEIGKKMGVV